MKQNSPYNQMRILLIIVYTIVFSWISVVPAEQSDNPTSDIRTSAAQIDSAFHSPDLAEELNLTTTSNIVDSPALGGFLSWCVVTFTDERSGEFELDAVPSSSVIGNYLTATPETDYAIAVFDTGAGAHIVSSEDAVRAGLYDQNPDLITSNTVEFTGVTGSAFAWVSQPLGLFINGLNAVESEELLLDTSMLVGQSNVSIAVGDPVDSSYSLSTVGTPLSVFLAAAYYNDNPISITRNGVKLLAPDIRFYSLDDPQIPSYPNKIHLELRPIGSVSVQYFPDILNLDDPFGMDFGTPLSPSVLTGFLPMQGLFFISSIDLAHEGRTSLDKDGFIFDTGSSYTVISEAIGARLGLNPNSPEFEIDILTATGEMIKSPGFYIDSLDLIATPQWLTFTNVPVIVLDAPSPEGGLLDGIIGTNLFVDFNFVVRGGGLPGQDQPRIEFERLPERIIADIAPGAGDGVVDLLDFEAFASVWLTNSESFNWNPRADMAPRNRPDGKVDFLDLAVFAEYWPNYPAP